MNSGRRAALHGIIAVSIAAALPHSLIAQVVRGTVSDSVSRRPIVGAVVMLLDGAGAVLDRNITGEQGEYRVTSDRAARSIKVVRIGFQPVELSLAERAGTERSLDISMGPFSTTLSTVRITDKSGVCPRNAERAAGFAIWEQARAGLLNSIIALKANPMSVHRLYFRRVLDAKTGSTTSLTVSEDYSGSASNSFSSVRSPTDLMRLGFAGDTEVVGYMFGPDAELLASDVFAQRYCFKVAEPDKARPTQVGVTFSAADFNKKRVDIDGTAWIDTIARTLHEVEFRYVGMPHAAEEFHPGGTISFATGANGVVFIDRYSLRLIGNAPDTIARIQCRGGCNVRNNFYPTENGAEVSHLTWRRGPPWDARLGTVSIRATTAAGEPARGGVVLLADTHYRGTADAKGVVRIPDLLPGPYAARVLDPRLSMLGISLPTSLTFVAARDSVVQLSLTVPTVEDFVVSECRTKRKWKQADSTYLLGRVVDHDGKPVADARVAFAVRQKSGGWVWEKDALKSGADGVFAACSTTLTSGSKLQVRVEGERVWSRDVTLDIAYKTMIVPIRVDVKP